MRFAKILPVKTFRAFAVTAGLLGAGAVFAQAPAAQSPALPAALSASHVAVAREVVLLSGISNTFTVFVPGIMQQIFNTVTPTRPELRKELEEVLKGLIPEYEKRTDEMIDVTARLFAANISEAQLKVTLEFFKSEAGKKYVEMQPKVIDQMVVAVDEWNRKLTQEVLERARAEMKKRGKDM